MQKVLTFIIPAYNVESCLSRALDSLLVPELSESLEVLIIDDGSRDGTAALARAYKARQPDLFRLVRKENGGHGSVINLGSRLAAGRYFKVLDADDWVVTENLPAFLAFLKTCRADAVLTPYNTVDAVTGGRTLERMYIADYGRVYTPAQIADDWKSFDRCVSFHGLTYRTAFYNENRHELTEGVFYEDREYSAIPFCLAGTAAVLDLVIYQYQVGSSTQSVAVKNQIARIGDLEKVLFSMIDYAKGLERAAVCGPGEGAGRVLLLKAEGVLLSYCTVMCIENPDRRGGAAACRRVTALVRRAWPALYASVKKKYLLYRLFALLRVSPDGYRRIIHAKAFMALRGSHGIEKA